MGLPIAYHGRGLGGLCTRLLTIVAEHLKADGIELTTAMDNESGFHTYLNAGYEYVGDIANPLEADVTAVLGEQASAARWRLERQMIHVLNQSRRADVLGLSGGEAPVVHARSRPDPALFWMVDRAGVVSEYATTAG